MVKYDRCSYDTVSYEAKECFFMIKPTFYNLPQEKRNRIINAVLNEFSSSSSEKVSINRIIKAANISRGSFYQYFDDKVDLVEILVKNFMDTAYEEFCTALANSDGDIFSTYIHIFELIAKCTNDKKQKVVMKNLFRNLKANDDLISDYLSNRFDGISEIFRGCDSVIKDNLRFKSNEDIHSLSLILTLILKNAVFNLFVKNQDPERVREEFMRKIKIIKAGALVSADA